MPNSLKSKIKHLCHNRTITERECDRILKALEQEPRKGEVILTKKEYGELVSSEFDNGYANGYREALEQEPFINKPCVSSGVCEHDKNKVLDKIRAEIMSKDGLEEALEIIDKYRTESEDAENGNSKDCN